MSAPNLLPAPDARRAPEPRSYRVEYAIDLSGWGLNWRCHTAGDGHWCVGGNWSAHRSETEAHAAGRQWIETGKGNA